MRIPFIAGNWKMNGSSSQIEQLVKNVKHGTSTFQSIEIAVFPPFVYLPLVHHLLKNSTIALGAQNLYMGKEGAFTGEVAGNMLMDVGCRYVLIGHSERRSLFHEDNALLKAKCEAALSAGLIFVLCVGETKADREAGKTETVIAEQLDAILPVIEQAGAARALIAYEPVWAIGTGLTATPEQAQAVHAFIRERIAQNKVDLSRTIRILYGGSMKPDNAASLLAMPDIDGGLIGGASLDAEAFSAICDIASNAMP